MTGKDGKLLPHDFNIIFRPLTASWARQTSIMGWENPLSPLFGSTNYWTNDLTCSYHTPLTISAFLLPLNIKSLYSQQKMVVILHYSQSALEEHFLIVFTLDTLHGQWTDGPVFWFKCVEFKAVLSLCCEASHDLPVITFIKLCLFETSVAELLIKAVWFILQCE